MRQLRLRRARRDERQGYDRGARKPVGGQRPRCGSCARAFGRFGRARDQFDVVSGGGKTSLLEATIAALPPDLKVAVIEGDLETENDAERIRRRGVPAVQITTGVACHLDAAMVHDALDKLPLDGVDILFIENVGNLVCPADFDVGQHLDVVLLSVPEGDDKPEKYPVIFRNADLVLITKIDLLPHIDDFDVERARRSLFRLRGSGRIVEISAKTSQGLSAWLEWLLESLTAARRAALDEIGTSPRG